MNLITGRIPYVRPNTGVLGNQFLHKIKTIESFPLKKNIIFSYVLCFFQQLSQFNFVLHVFLSYITKEATRNQISIFLREFSNDGRNKFEVLGELALSLAGQDQLAQVYTNILNCLSFKWAQVYILCISIFFFLNFLFLSWNGLIFSPHPLCDLIGKIFSPDYGVHS